MIRTARRPLAARPALGVAAGVALATVLLAGCSSGSATGTASASGSKAASGRSGATARNRFAAAGLVGPIASVGSGSFTVTGASGGTDTVNWGTGTTFERTASGGLVDVTSGSCVAVTEASGSDASTGSVDATAVRISRPVNGSCSAGAAAGFNGGGRRSPSGGAGASGGARPSGGFGGGAARSMLAGSVDSVTASGFVVDVVTPGTASGGTSTTTTTSVTVSGATTYTVTTPGSAGDLAVGECARVFSGARPGASASASPSASPSSAPSSAPSGTTSSGPVTAVSVTLSAPVNGSCTVAVPGRRSSGSAAPTPGSSGAGA